MSGAAPFFLPMEQGDRFCVLHGVEDGQCKGGVVYVHPFAEELNRSRRMAALQARALCGAGWSVLQIDLFGCGDSAGDFGEATLHRWLDDVVNASRWLETQTGRRPALWGLRAGCLVAAQAARSLGTSQLLLWQPVLSGRLFLQQFLRLRVGSQIVSQGAVNTTGPALREQLQNGRSVEVTGYTVSPELASELDGAALEPPEAVATVAWLEVSSSREAALSPASRAQVERWRDGGHAVEARVVAGPAFWQTVEITEARELIGATLQAVEAWES